MKNLELYKKYKVASATTSAAFSNSNLRLNVIVIIAVLLVEPFIMYKYHRRVPFTFDYYIHQIAYFSLIIIPFGTLLLWTNLREAIKQNRGYNWMGKFEVLDKQTSMTSYYLLLAPGDGNKIKVNRALFNKARVGDLITINRNALGNIEEIKKLNGIKERLKRSANKKI